ncbi:hypothetical protein T08_4621 [Trichinella sp. T8]|nr:hypothetical protein T08_4621 [Trichinella sp. T8]
MHNNTQVSDRKGSKPDIIVHYNNTKSSVNNLDQVTSDEKRCPKQQQHKRQLNGCDKKLSSHLQASA